MRAQTSGETASNARESAPVRAPIVREVTIPAVTVTSFLLGEYMPAERESDPVFTIADSILWLSQEADRNSVVRKLQIVKVRGQGNMPGLHTFKITHDGLRDTIHLENMGVRRVFQGRSGAVRDQEVAGSNPVSPT